jgi:predicted DNA binding CopG/RHH family protein
MRQPKLNDLRIDLAGTRRLRTQLKKAKTIKITINVDAASLGTARKSGSKKSLPYHRVLSQLLKENSIGKANTRLDRIEREIRKLKRQIAA